MVVHYIVVTNSPSAGSSFLSRIVGPSSCIVYTSENYGFTGRTNVAPGLIMKSFSSRPSMLFPGYRAIHLVPRGSSASAVRSISLTLRGEFSRVTVLNTLNNHFSRDFTGITILSCVRRRKDGNILLSRGRGVRFLPMNRCRCGGFGNGAFSLFPFKYPDIYMDCSKAGCPLRGCYISDDIALNISGMFASSVAAVSVCSKGTVLVVGLVSYWGCDLALFTGMSYVYRGRYRRCVKM